MTGDWAKSPVVSKIMCKVVMMSMKSLPSFPLKQKDVGKTDKFIFKVRIRNIFPPNKHFLTILSKIIFKVLSTRWDTYIHTA